LKDLGSILQLKIIDFIILDKFIKDLQEGDESRDKRKESDGKEAPNKWMGVGTILILCQKASRKIRPHKNAKKLLGSTRKRQ